MAANLAPRKMKFGISEGMILASGPGGKDVFLLDVRTPGEFRDVRLDGAKVEIHLGEALDALSDLKNRGYKVLGEVKAPNGNYERVFVADLPTDVSRLEGVEKATGKDIAGMIIDYMASNAKVGKTKTKGKG